MVITGLYYAWIWKPGSTPMAIHSTHLLKHHLTSWIFYHGGWTLSRPAPALSPSLNELVVPHQEDSFSCGIVVLSTLACKLVDGCGLWEQHLHAFKRMEWYLRLSEYLRNCNDVSRKVLFICITTKNNIVFL